MHISVHGLYENAHYCVREHQTHLHTAWYYIICTYVCERVCTYEKCICMQTIASAPQTHTRVNKRTCMRMQVERTFDVWAIFVFKCIRTQDGSTKTFGTHYICKVNNMQSGKLSRSDLSELLRTYAAHEAGYPNKDKT